MLNLIKDTQVISIIGMSKNVGKTTVLNYIINNLDSETNYALTSVGLDGENLDLLTNTTKPRIYVRKGTIIATSFMSLNNCDISIKVLEATDIFTALGIVVIVEAMSDGYVLLAGPTTKDDVRMIVEKLKKYHPKNIIVDGAVDRSASVDIFSDAVILATGANYSTNVETLVCDTLFKVKLFDFDLKVTNPIVERFYQSREKLLIILDDDQQLTSKSTLITEDELVFTNLNKIKTLMINGSCGESFVNRLLSIDPIPKIQIILRNPMCLFINAKTYQRLEKNHITFGFYQSLKIIAVTINPYSLRNEKIDTKRFIELFSKESQIPIFDVVGDRVE